MTDTEPTLEESLSAAFDEMQEAPEAVASAERDERGRFQAKAPDPEIPAVENPPEETHEITDQGETAAPVEAAQPIDAPASWSAEDKAIFSNLPPEAQKVIAQRESERERFLTQKSQEAAKFKSQYEPLNSLIEPRRNLWAANGYSPDQAIGQIIAIAEQATADPVKFIQQFASDNGIDLTALAQPNAQGQSQAPNLAPVITEINAIKQQLHAEKQAAINSQIEAFRSAPGHEHFDEVRTDMAALLKEARAKDMQEAYEKACWAHPAVRTQMLEAQRKADEQKRIDAAKQAAAKAQKSAGTQLSSKASLPASNPAPSSWEESLSRAYDQMHASL